MKRTTSAMAILSLVVLAAAPALAEDTATPGAAAGTTTTPATQATPAPDAQSTPATQSAPATPAPDAATPPTSPAPASGDVATPAAAPAGDALAMIRTEGKKADPGADKKATAAIDAAASDVDKTSTADGDAKIAERLAAEFGVTSDVLLAEKNDVKTGWGQLMIAHSLMANSTANVTAKQLFDLRTEGMSWGQIANGMGLRLGEAVKATKEESRVAKGLSKPDGKVAVVHGVGSKFGTSANPPKATKVAKADAAKTNANADKAAAPEAAPSSAGDGAGADGGKK